jgi:hypothetical protein
VADDDDVDVVCGDRWRRDGGRGYERRRCDDGRLIKRFMPFPPSWAKLPCTSRETRID